MRISFEELIYWMEEDWGIPAPDGYLLLAQVAEARCTQMVNPKYSYIQNTPIRSSSIRSRSQERISLAKTNWTGRPRSALSSS
jgi:hypothetical protein